MSSNPWSDSDDEEEEEEHSQAEEQFVTAYKTNALPQLPIENVEEGVERVEDIELLEEVYLEVDDEEVAEVVESRLDELDALLDNSETEQTESESMSEDTEVEESSIDVSSIAPNAMGPEEAKEQEHIFRTMVWGEPGSGKTHFVYTAEEPVCIIDTENKGEAIAHKFDKDFYLWQPEGYDELIESMNEALDVLDHYRSEKGVIGTLAVDSMSICWEWAQQKYVDKYYPNTDFSDAKEQFSSGFSGGQSDWKQIKSYHNDKFRDVMTQSPYHLVWTQMSEQDYEEKLENDVDVMKPVGEKNNVYKVDHILHIEQDSSGIPTGSLEKSGLTKYRFTGLEYPTFGKMQDVVNSIEEAELSDEDVDVDELTEYDISVMQGNPRFVGDE